MKNGYKTKYNTHLIRILVILVVAAVGGYLVRGLLLPDEFGKYGHYRPAAVEEEKNRPIRNKTNDSCMECHHHIREMHLEGIHKTVSCEFCHGPYADHIEDGRVTDKLPVKKGEEIKKLCLRCHNEVIRARPPESIKMISLPEHLKEKNVSTDHICDQCHNVHAPLMYVKAARRMTGLKEEEE